jgi:hypothetical protein
VSLPDDLAVTQCPFGVGEVLFALAASNGQAGSAPTTCVAPAGVRAFEGESAEDLDCWRRAMWWNREEVWSEPPDTMQKLTWAELVGLLPDKHHHWVRLCARERLRAIRAFGVPADDDDPQPAYQRCSERSAELLLRALRDAFPDEEPDLQRELSGELSGIGA